MKYRTGNDATASAGKLDCPGRFHVMVMKANNFPTKGNGEPIDKALFQIHMRVLAGTVEGKRDAIIEEMFFYPNEPNNFTQRKNDRFLIAANVLDPKLISESDVDLDLNIAVGAQLFIEIAADEWKGTTRYKMKGCCVYHVDDPEVKNEQQWPRDAEMIKTIPAERRWKAGEGIVEPNKPAPVNVNGDDKPF